MAESRRSALERKIAATSIQIRAFATAPVYGHSRMITGGSSNAVDMRLKPRRLQIKTKSLAVNASPDCRVANWMAATAPVPSASNSRAPVALL